MKFIKFCKINRGEKDKEFINENFSVSGKFLVRGYSIKLFRNICI